MKKRIKKHLKQNYIAVIVLLAGALVGSLFVDVAQIMRKTGFSERAVHNADIIRYDGRTWVAYTDDIVSVRVVTDTPENCPTCQLDELVTWLRYTIPTVQIEKVMVNSPQGQELVRKLHLTHIPSFVFDRSITPTSFFRQTSSFFAQTDELYHLRLANIGFDVGQYIAPPSREHAITDANTDGVPITIFGDFECSACAKLHKTIAQLQRKLNRDISVAFIYTPMDLNNNAQGERAVMAAYCASDQGKFAQYAQVLFDRRTRWARAKTDAVFVQYARRARIKNIKEFAQCMKQDRHKEDILAGYRQADDFMITATPSIFVGKQFHAGTISPDDLRKMVEVIGGKE